MDSNHALGTPLRTLEDVGQRVAQLRKADRRTATEISRKSARSRDILNRLERGEDVSLSSLVDILQAMGYVLDIRRAGPPTLEEVRERFAPDDEEA